MRTRARCSRLALAIGRVSTVEQLEARQMLSIAEPNDTIATAYRVDAGRPFGGSETFNDSISATDQRDYYRLNLNGSRNALTVRLYNLSADLQLALMQDINGNGTIESNELLKISVNAGTTEETIVRTSANSPLYQSDQYFVEVYSAGSGNNSSYSLDLTADTAGDTPQTARYLPTAGLQLVTERLDNSSDLYDIYKLDLNNNGNSSNQTSFSIVLQSSNAANYHVDLLEDLNNNSTFDSGELITTSHLVNGVQEIIGQVRPTNDGHFHYIRVLHSAPSTDDYVLRTDNDVAGSTPTTAKNLGDPESSLLTVREGIGALGSLNDFDDYFKFTIVNPGYRLYSEIQIDPYPLSPSPTATVSYEIFRDANSNGIKDSTDPVISSGGGGPGGGGGTAAQEQPGTYYFHVFGTAPASYKVSLNADDVPGIVGSNKFSDSLSRGTIAQREYSQGALGANDTSDTYKFTFPTAGGLIGQLDDRGLGAAGSVAVDFNGNGLLDPGETIGTFSYDNSKKFAVPAGNVYVTVSAPTAVDIYSYNLYVTPDFAGDTPQAARNIGTLGGGAFAQFTDEVDQKLFGYSVDDPDYYKFTLSSSQTLTAAMLGGVADCDVVLYQDNGGGSVTELQRVSGADSNKTLQRTIPAGNYQLAIVNMDTTYNQQEYTLGLSTGDNDDQIGEVNLLPPSWITPGGGRDMTLSDSGDVDMTRIGSFLSYGHYYAVDIDSRNGSAIDTYVRVFDETGKQIASNDNGTAPGETADGFSYLEFRVPISGRYYVAVGAHGNTAYSPLTGGGDTGGTSSGQYRLNITDITGTLGSVSGVVFNDLNGNGIKDAGEAGIANRAVFIDTDGNNNWDDGENGAYTDATGTYKITDVPRGPSSLRQRIPSGWAQTSPANNGPLNINFSAGQNLTGQNFGVRQGSVNTASIAGRIWDDVDGNGVIDSTEPGIAGRTVYLDANNNSILDSGEKHTTTDVSGNYKFSNLAAGTYKIREVLPSGWSQTLPTSNFGNNATLASGQSVTGKNFGARPTPAGTASIAGSVFHDFDRDGTRDTGDTGIGGWLVYIDLDNDSVMDANEQRMLTDASGNYRFINLSAGTYKVREVLQSGFTQTTPTSNFGRSVTVTSGQAAAGANFGVDN